MGEFVREFLERLPDLRATLLEHLLVLTLVPVTIATLIAVPLAIYVRHRPLWRSLSLGVTGIVQTIPSLAMLAFLLPIFGIGKLPAIIALTLYAILPILQNTITALRDLPGATLEAADGLGFSPQQRLFLIELPLALPVIMSGIQTATIICVGVATLSTFIGAGGLGDFINRGLSLNRMSLLVIGASAAAALALMLDFVIDTVGLTLQPGRKPKSLRGRYVVCLLFAVLLMGVVLAPLLGYAGSRTPRDGSGTVRIGSKNFTEQILLGELLAQWIEEKTDLQAERYLNMGGTVICHQALIKGEIDLYVEYSGTAWLTLLGRPYDARTSPEVMLSQLRDAYESQFACVVLPPLGFENTYAITVRGAAALENGWESISDLRPQAPTLRAGFTAEFMEREDGLQGLTQTYGLQFAQLVDLGPELMYPAIAQGEVDVIGAFSTDGRILEFGLETLEDDRNFFPPYEAIPIVRRSLLERFPQLEPALRELRGELDDATMMQLNHAVDVEKRSTRDVAREFVQGRINTKPID